MFPPFCLTQPDGTRGENKTYIQYKIRSLFFQIFKDKETIFGVFWDGVPSILFKPGMSLPRFVERRMQTGVGGRGHDASPASSLLSAVDTGVDTTAAFLVRGWGLYNTQRQQK